MVEDFTATWQIIDHVPNTSSGFSATLLRNLLTGEYTLSFRSTETKDAEDGGDVLRDSSNGANGQIAGLGFAWGQLRDMQRYFQELLSGELRTGSAADGQAVAAYLAGSQINVTGYSLGGHLAQIFTLMHQDQVAATHTFNGAGFGTIDGVDTAAAYGQVVTERLALLDAVEANPQAYLGELTSVEWHELGYSVDVAAAAGYSLLTPADALADLLASRSEYLAANGAYDSLYDDPLFQFAMRALPGDTTGALAVTVRELFPDGFLGLDVTYEQRTEFDKIANWFGFAVPGDERVLGQVVAGAGQIFGSFEALYIEEQPVIDSDFEISLSNLRDSLLRSFGASHSIALLADSVAVMDLYQRLDPTLDLSELNRLFAAMTASSASDLPRRAEGDTLEAAVDALGRLLLGGEWTATPYSQTPGSFGDIGLRDAFFDNVQRVRQALDTLGLGNAQVLNLLDLSADELKSRALQADGSGLAYRYALQELNPFAITSTDPAELQTLYAGQSSGLALADFTETYIEDRARLLALKTRLAFSNEQRETFSSEGNAAFIDDAADFAAVTSADGDLIAQRRFVVFGSERSQAIDVPGLWSAGAEHLYGGGGVDTLRGGSDGDHLEGNADDDVLIGGGGADTLLGGEGYDTYRLSSGELGDTIVDSDGSGQVIVDAARARLGIHQDGDPDGVYRSPDGLFTFTLQPDNTLEVTVNATGGQFVIRDYDAAARSLGIELLDTAPGGLILNATGADDGVGIEYDAQSDETRIARLPGIDGGWAEQTLPGVFTEVRGLGGDDALVIDSDLPGLTVFGDGDDPGAAAGGDDILQVYDFDLPAGQSPVDAANGARIHGGAGDDDIDGSQRNDRLEGNAGHDALDGNAGGDLVSGGAGGDLAAGGADADQVFGGPGNDWLLGGAGRDGLSGDAGDDRLWGDANARSLYQGERLWDGSALAFVTPDSWFDIAEPNQDQALLFADPAAAGDDVLDGGAGEDRLYGGPGGDVLYGGAGADHLQGEGGDDFLYGQDGFDTLWGDKDPDSYQQDQTPLDTFQNASLFFRLHGDPVDVAGNDWLDGGAGDDRLFGGGGDDGYVFGYGYGHDVIDDQSGAADSLRLSGGIGPDDVVLSATGADLVIEPMQNGVATGDRLSIRNWQSSGQIESIEFDGAILWRPDDIRNAIDEHTLQQDTVTQGGVRDTAYLLPEGLAPGFDLGVADAGGDDTLRLDIQTSAIPGGPTITVTPGLQGYLRDGDDLVLDILMDSNLQGGDAQGTLRIEDYFLDSGWIETIVFPGQTLNLPNNAPLAAASLPDQELALDAPFQFPLPAGTFGDDPIDVLGYTATLGDGSPLPRWLSIDPATGALSGTPSWGDRAFLKIDITATDRGGLTAATRLRLNVGGINAPPEAAAPIPDQVAVEDRPLSYTLPAVFADPNAGDTLAYTATLHDGTPLPGWLSFDPAALTLSGTPGAADVGDLELLITATDAGGLSAAQSMRLKVVDSGAIVGSGVISGTAADDLIVGSASSDIFVGSAGNDRIYGLDGADFFSGTAGTLIGGAGSDSYAPGSSRDTVIVEQSGDADTLSFAFGEMDFSAADIRRVGDDLVLFRDDGEAVVIRDHYLDVDHRVDWFASEGHPDNAFAEGSWTADAFEAFVGRNPRNQAPRVAQAMGDAGIEAGAASGIPVPEGTFFDYDAGDALTLGARLANGGPLPDWLSFEPAAARFSATPSYADAGDYAIELRATDPGGLAATMRFTLSVASSLTRIAGTAGDDLLIGTDGDDLIDGGAGSDTLQGGAGDDVYLVEDRDDQVIELAGEGRDAVHAGGTYALPDHVEELYLLGGGHLVGYGNALDNLLVSNEGPSLLKGGAGDDVLIGSGAANTLVGERGDDTLEGRGGDDHLVDVWGGDTYRFARGDGVDRVTDYGFESWGYDVVQFDGDIAHDQLWLSEEGADLVIATLGTDDRVVVSSWRSSVVGVEAVRAGDGLVADYAGMQQLVDAMAAFDPPQGTDLHLSAELQQQLEPVFAVAWQAA